MMHSFRFLTILLFAWRSVNAYTGYLSYKNAKCTSDGGILGTLVLSYDDEELNEYGGYSMSWDSMCLAYEGGSFNFGDEEDDDITWPDYEWGATCITCNGVTGCSSDGTCANFLTYAGDTSSNSYQSSGSSSSGSSTKMEEVSANAFGFTQNAKDSIVQGQETGRFRLSLPLEESSSASGTMIIGGAGCFVAFAIVGVLLVRRQWKRGEEEGAVEMAYHRDSSVMV
mmetsp:Transcript_33293/g.50218  ORF Transcript_33293/g.50218 Transcript_33293/m.50218 type:complete len:226 (+) Transcript_33293:73-750(+)